MKTRRRTKKLVLSAILSALGVVIMYLGSIITVLDLTMVAIVSLIIFFSVIEMQESYPYLIYGTTAILALLLLPDKTGAVIYLLFGGIYPIFKEMFERLHPLVCWVLKFSAFNTALLFLIVAINYIMKVADSDLGFTLPVFFLGNLTFVLYDIATTKLVTFYFMKIRPRLKLKDYFAP